MWKGIVNEQTVCVFLCVCACVCACVHACVCTVKNVV